ncbi:MAG: peroxiredoxin [bacterium]
MQIGHKAPHFDGIAVMPDGQFKELSLADYAGKWLVFFFYPLDFTFICPTEVRGFSVAYEKFTAVGADLLGCSVDSQFAHLAWINDPELGKIKFPLLSDVTKKISRDYNVLIPEKGYSLRGTFIIDPEGILKSIVVNDTAIGRSVDETVRTLRALQTGEMTGCGWEPGDPTLGREQ